MQPIRLNPFMTGQGSDQQQPDPIYQYAYPNQPKGGTQSIPLEPGADLLKVPVASASPPPPEFDTMHGGSVAGHADGYNTATPTDATPDTAPVPPVPLYQLSIAIHLAITIIAIFVIFQGPRVGC
jgi:hypothetical protein